MAVPSNTAEHEPSINFKLLFTGASTLWHGLLPALMKKCLENFGTWTQCHPNFKISLLTTAPPKNRLFCTIINLSYSLCHAGQCLPSVSQTYLHPKPMEQLGHLLPHIIHIIAIAKPIWVPFSWTSGTWKTVWHVSVSKDDAWHFCPLLPSLPGETMMIITTNSLAWIVWLCHQNSTWYSPRTSR